MNYRWLATGLVAVVALSLAGWAGWDARSTIAERDIAALQARHAEAVAAAASAAAAAEREAHAETNRKTHRLQEIADAERLATADRQAASRRAAVAARSLHDAAKAATGALAAAAASDASPSDRSAAVAGTGMVFADMLGSCGAQLAEVAAWADEAHARGRACERAYDAVSEP